MRYTVSDYKRYIERRLKRIHNQVCGRLAFHADKKRYCLLFEENEQEDKKVCSIFEYSKKNKSPYYTDRYDAAGNIDCHYFVQDIYMANKVIKNDSFSMHYDIGSRLDGFIAHLLSADVPVTMIDVRPLDISIKGLGFVQGNAANLEQIENQSIESISCLHALEHFGLGRYGDPIDPMCWYKALREYERILKPDGHLYLSVPIGPQNVLMFNAQRIFKPNVIADALNDLELESFSYIKDYNVIELNSINDYCEETNNLCGLFVFKKSKVNV